MWKKQCNRATCTYYALKKKGNKKLYLHLEFLHGGGVVVSYSDPIFTAADGVDLLLQNQDDTGVLEYIFCLLWGSL